ncbi:MAG: gamma-glutamyltransferase family protein [Alphaproteobacteria bacterium]|nr:gamma-glutamyltransferase family protein [Alphaproteobacteria bacterium]
MSQVQTRPEIRGTFGVVASTHWLASAAAMGVLEKGGNAFDAAVTAGFTLQVVEPHLNGIGGDMPAILWDAKRRASEVICAQGPAPAAATIARYRKEGHSVMPGSGLMAACVPGAFDGWTRMLRDYGTIALEEALAPAIHYAGGGYPLVPRIIETISLVEQLFRDEWKSSAAVYLPGGKLPTPFKLFRNPALAETYRRLVQAGRAAGGDRVAQIEAARRAWREGFVAETVDKFCRSTEAMDSSGQRHRGLLTGADMAKWQSHVEKPVTGRYRDITVAKCGAWSQGPVALQQLALLEGFDMARLKPTDAEWVHTVVECAKLAFADREAWYGDPDFVDVPLKTLLSREYADARRKLVTAQASRELRPGSPDGRKPRLAEYTVVDTAVPYDRAAILATAGTGEPTVGRLGMAAGDTCHLDVIDRHGNMVAATPSGGWLQSSPVIPELGFCLGTRAQMFWLEEGLPCSLEPGKRPRTTLTPGLAFDAEGRALMAFGSPGGDQQDQWSVQLVVRHIDNGMNLQAAIDCPAFHTDHILGSFFPRRFTPGALTVEDRFGEVAVSELRRRGHNVTVGDSWSEGRLCAAAIERTPEGDILKAAANPRGAQNYALGR